MNILFTICGRAGSKGFKNKNLKRLNHIPLIYYTLSVISLYRDKHKADNIMVALNTDSKELIELVQKQDLLKDIYIAQRKEELAGDLVPKIAVVQSTYQQCREAAAFDAVVDLDITSPMRRLSDVEAAVNELGRNPDYDVVFSVVPSRRTPYFNMVEKKGEYYKKICPSNYMARQQAPRTYELNASIYVYNPGFLEKKLEKTILEYNCGISVMPDYLVLDIDSQEDFEIMEKMFAYFGEKDEELGNIIKICEETFIK